MEKNKIAEHFDNSQSERPVTVKYKNLLAAIIVNVIAAVVPFSLEKVTKKVWRCRVSIPVPLAC